jgi:hypothetical protein
MIINTEMNNVEEKVGRLLEYIKNNNEGGNERVVGEEFIKNLKILYGDFGTRMENLLMPRL